MSDEENISHFFYGYYVVICLCFCDSYKTECVIRHTTWVVLYVLVGVNYFDVVHDYVSFGIF